MKRMVGCSPVAFLLRSGDRLRAHDALKAGVLSATQ